MPSLRDLRGRNALNHDLKNLAIIPFVPFAVSHRDHPERTWIDESPNLNGFRPLEDLADAIAAEADAQGLFRRVQRVGGGLHGERFELRGSLLDCHVSEGYLTYGLSALSIVLHLVGAPEGTVRCGLRIRLELVDRSDGSVSWSGELRDTATRVTWIHASREADVACRAFAAILQSRLPAVVAELRQSLARRGT